MMCELDAAHLEAIWLKEGKIPLNGAYVINPHKGEFISFNLNHTFG